MYDYVSYPYWDQDAGFYYLTCYYQGRRLVVHFDSREAAYMWRSMSESPVWESLLLEAEPEPVFNHRLYPEPHFYNLLELN